LAVLKTCAISKQQAKGEAVWRKVMALDPSMPVLVVDDYKTMIRIIVL